jgi:DeoR/GlpR family transcriptional regulator of sugar metabolism
MGVTGIHPEAGLTTGDYEEAHIKYALCQHAAETFVLASTEKLGAASPYTVAPFSEISGLIVEQDLPEEIVKPYQALGLSIIRAG